MYKVRALSRIFPQTWINHGFFSIYHYYRRMDQRSCDGRGGGAQRLVLPVNEPKKTSARESMRGQNPLVEK